MIRTLPVFKATVARAAIALAATGLLAGCITGDYAYRNGGHGDYYYGQPSVDYRYQGYGDYGYYPYGETYRFRSHYGYGYPYSYPYGGYPYQRGYPYYGGHYGYPYHYPYRPRRPVVVHPPRPDGSVPPPQHRPDGRPPWRNLDELRRRQQVDGGTAQERMQVPVRPAPVEPRRSESRMDEVIRRSSEARGPRESDERHEP